MSSHTSTARSRPEQVIGSSPVPHRIRYDLLGRYPPRAVYVLNIQWMGVYEHVLLGVAVINEINMNDVMQAHKMEFGATKYVEASYSVQRVRKQQGARVQISRARFCCSWTQCDAPFDAQLTSTNTIDMVDGRNGKSAK